MLWGPSTSDEMAGLHIAVVPVHAEDEEDLASALGKDDPGDGRGRVADVRQCPAPNGAAAYDPRLNSRRSNHFLSSCPGAGGAAFGSAACAGCFGGTSGFGTAC